MRKWAKRFGVLLALCIVGLGVFAVPTLWFKPWSINHFYLRVLVEAVIDDPLLLTQLKLAESVGIRYRTDALPDMTLAHREKLRDLAKRNLRILQSYDTSGMNDDAKLSYDVMSWLLTRWSDAADRFLEHPYAINQLDGLHVRFPDVMVNYHRVETERDARDYLARVSKISAALAALTATAEALEKRGFSAPGFILAKVARDAAEFAARPLEQNPLREDFAKKVEALTGLDAEAKRALLREMDHTLKESALPGYDAFAKATSAMAGRSSASAGVWRLPDGEAWYQNRIEDSTTTTMTASEIHAVGLGEVERIQREMSALMDAQGVEAGTFRERIDRVAADPRFQWADDDAGRAAILAEYTRIIDDVNRKLEPMFRTDPKKPVVVERVPPFKEKTSPGAYYFPEALDGSKPGTFYANLRDVKAHVKYSMRTLAYHEAVPGHHFQLSIARAQKQLPLIRQMLPMTAYSEGWALYAEQLAAENGLEDDPYDRLGYLQAQLFRGVRLVVDTGLHSKRWSREQAIDYFYANTGMARGEAEAEVERYCVWPGQALGYMVGRLKMLELREKARQKLGDQFELREFHDVVLLGGALPLALLEREVDRWLAHPR